MENRQSESGTLPVDLKPVIEKVRMFTLAAVPEERYMHSLRTAEMAQKLCKLYNVDADRGYLAGIGHDMCKNMNSHLLLMLAGRDGKQISALEKEKPSLLHGRAAAVKMREDFGIMDQDILQAVACHTFGGENLCPLAKILYVADKIEPGRDYITNDYLEKLFRLDIDSLALTVVEENVGFLKKRKRPIAPETLLFLDSLKKEIKSDRDCKKKRD